MIDDRPSGTSGTDPRATRPGPAEGRPATVLHVEPNPESAELLAAFLERFTPGLEVRSVRRASEAHDALADVDLVIAEQRLPDGSGLDLLRSARERGIRTPFLFHTTCRDSIVETRAFEVGAVGYVHKRSTRGQYDRLLDVLRENVATVDDGGSVPSRRSTGSSTEPGTDTWTTPLRSEE
jgi:CheY-like chemotaxis protein